MPKKPERVDLLGFFKIHSAAKLQNKLKGGPLGKYLFFEKSHFAKKKLKRGLKSRPVLYVTRKKKKKPFWFNPLGQMVHFDTKTFRRTFGRTILVTSDVSKKKHCRKAMTIVDSFLKESAD